MTNFISKIGGLTIREAVYKDGVQTGSVLLARFTPLQKVIVNGSPVAYGSFQTDDEDLIKKLKARSSYGRSFKIAEGKMPHFQSEHIVKGAVTSVDAQQLEAQKKNLEEQNKIALEEQKEKQAQDFIRFGELSAKLLNKEGGYRKDATEDLKKEYENLKEKIGV